MNFQETYSKYTKDISLMLMVISNVSDHFKSKELHKILYVYSNLLMYKESVGQKRAVLNALFSGNKDSDKIYEYFLTADVQERIYLKSFLHSIGDSVNDLYFNFLNSDPVKKIKDFEELAIKKFTDSSIEVDSKKWFQVATYKIDLIQMFEYEILTQIDAIRNSIHKKVHKGLTKEERVWIENNIVKVGVEQWSPVIFSNNGTDIDGIAGDFLKNIIEISGLKIEIVNKGWNDLLTDFKAKKIDLLPATYFTEKRSEFGLYSDSYFKMKDSIFVKDESFEINSMKDLKGKRLAVIEGYGTIDKIRRDFPEIDIVLTRDLSDSIFQVLNGNVDALFEGEIAVRNKIQDELIVGLKAIPQISFRAAGLHFFSNIDEPILQSIIQKSLKQITKYEKDKIISKWIKNGGDREVIHIQQNSSVSFEGILSEEEFVFILIIFFILILLLYKQYKKSNILDINIKTFNIVIMTFEIIIIIILIFEIAVLDRTENKLTKAQIEKLEMLQAIDKLRQSSDDLTHFARTYVITNNIRFKDQYFATLNIRNGKKKRPAGYNGIYWDLNQHSREMRHPNVEKIALKDMFIKLPFLEYERLKLKESEDNSNNLVNLEVRAFLAMKNGDQRLAIKILHSEDYYIAKHQIMLPIDELISFLKDRTNLEIIHLNRSIKIVFRDIFIIGVIFILGNIFIFSIYRKKIYEPVDYLTNVIKRFQNGEKDIERREFYKDELGEMNREFFHMKKVIEENTEALTKSNKNIRESIKFASFIQHALLPDNLILDKFTKESFTFWKPRDTVGGDIYFITELNNDEVLMMVIDGAGHGVPGAFVTMLVKAIETQIIGELKAKTLKPSPALILEYFNQSIKMMLRQEKGSKSNAGFDGGVLYYNRKENICKYAGAKTPLYIIDENGNLEILKSDRKNVGFVRTKIDQKYTEYDIEIKEGTQLYLCTDGIIDQEGKNDKRYGKKRFERLILENYNKPLAVQQWVIQKDFEDFRFNCEQSDDITVMGLKF